MSKAKRWSQRECLNEAAFIASIDPSAPGGSFNDSPECFARYCEMQAAQVKHSGFDADSILDARDRALAMDDY